MKVEFKRATAEDVGAMCRRGMRRADEIEALRMGFPDPYLALLDSVQDSAVALAAYTPNGIACLVGAYEPSLLSDGAHIWLIGSEDLERYKVRFMKESRVILDALLGKYAKLENWVDADNTGTLCWLEWLGFTIDRASPITTMMGYPFYHVFKEA